MCGICGIINFNQQPIQEEKIRKMMKRMKHRGPDDEGVFLEENIGLGFVRLSILDLSEAGHQPMFSNNNGRIGQSDNESGSENRYVIVYNGEVYNYIEIREELKSKGYVFKSNTDTEVVLNSYIEWGEDCLHKFNGMWAFGIYDRKLKELFFARDRYGVKPYYYYNDGIQFAFASEISPLLDVFSKKPSVNNKILYDYFMFNRTEQSEDTFFEGVKKLQHGHSIRLKIEDLRLKIKDSRFKIEDSRFKIKRWYDLRQRVSKLQGEKETRSQGDKGIFEEYRELLSSAVGLRLRSDVPVGVCLSGGLDSSSIVSVLFDDYNLPLNSFSAIYGNNVKEDESLFIKELQGYVKDMNYINIDHSDLLQDINDFIFTMNEPVPFTSPYAQYKVLQLASKHVTVLINGQGADEYLGGYHYFYGTLFKELLLKFDIFSFIKENYYYLKYVKSFYALSVFIYFLMPQFIKHNIRRLRYNYLSSDFERNFKYKENIISKYIYGSNSLRESFLNHFEYKLEHLLKWEDILSMRFSLESRLPFLDYRLVESTLALNSNFIICNGINKYILRKSLNNILPEKILHRYSKNGFDTPQDEWFRNTEFRNFINSILNDKNSVLPEILNMKKVKLLYNRHLKREINIGNEIWKWINLHLWFNYFVK